MHYVGLIPICGISHGCETVQTSVYAYLGGIPVALLGLLVYLILIATSLSRREGAVLAGFGLSLVAFAFSAYLTYRELFTIHAICSWCATSAILLTLLFVVNAARVATRTSPATAINARTAAPAAGGSATR